MKKINWKFWRKPKEVESPKNEVVTIPTSWMRYILAVLPDANEYYVKGTVNINPIPFDVVRQEPLAGQYMTSPYPRVEAKAETNSVLFIFHEFKKEVRITLVRSVETISYGGQEATVETYLWDLSGMRVIGNAGWSAMCRSISDRAKFTSSYLIDRNPEDGSNGIVPQSPRGKDEGMNFKYKQPFYDQDIEDRSESATFCREGEMPEMKEGKTD